MTRLFEQVLKGELQRAKSALSENESKWEYERNTLASKAEEVDSDDRNLTTGLVNDLANPWDFSCKLM